MTRDDANALEQLVGAYEYFFDNFGYHMYKHILDADQSLKTAFDVQKKINALLTSIAERPSR